MKPAPSTEFLTIPYSQMAGRQTCPRYQWFEKEEDMPEDTRPLAPRWRLPLILLLLPAPVFGFLLLDALAMRMTGRWPEWLRQAAMASTDAVQLIPILLALGAGMALALLLNRRQWLEAGCYTLASVLVASAFTHALKPVIGRARPTVFEAEGLSGRRLFDGSFDYVSFPSGHATQAAAFFAALAFAFPRLRLPFALLGLWFALTRILIGVHHPSDVIAGLLVGLGTAIFIARIASRMGFVFRK